METPQKRVRSPWEEGLETPGGERAWRAPGGGHPREVGLETPGEHARLGEDTLQTKTWRLVGFRGGQGRRRGRQQRVRRGRPQVPVPSRSALGLRLLRPGHQTGGRRRNASLRVPGRAGLALTLAALVPGSRRIPRSTRLRGGLDNGTSEEGRSQGARGQPGS